MGTGIASSVIDGLVNIGTSVLSGYWQNEALEAGQEESRRMYEGQMAESKAARLASEKLNKQELRLRKKQLEENTRLTEAQLALNKEKLGMQREQIARTGFRDQYSRLTSILESNEQLKGLYINRLRGLRS